MLGSVLTGNKVQGVPARAYVYTTIKWLDSPPVSPFGPDGTMPHFLYIANANMNWRTSSDSTQPDYVPQEISVEFGTPSVFSVPFDGTLQFVGGNPTANFLAYIYIQKPPCNPIPIDTSNYQPTWHWLRRQVPTAGFTVPDNHTAVVGYSSTDTFSVNGVPLNPAVNAPGTTVSPGDFILPVYGTTILATGWFG